MSGFTNSKGKFFSRQLLQERLETGTAPSGEFNDTVFGIGAMLRSDGVALDAALERATGFARAVRPDKVGEAEKVVRKIYYEKGLPFK